MRARVMTYLTGQAAQPSGPGGEIVAAGLNRANRAMIQAAVRACGLAPGQTAADIGFGGGAGLALLLNEVGSSGRVQGVEISARMLTRAHRHYREPVTAGRLQLLPGSANKLPLDAATVDAVMTVNTVYFLDALTPMLFETARVLRPGGRLVIGIRDPGRMKNLPIIGRELKLRSAIDIAAVMAAAGFDVHARHYGADHPVGTILAGLINH